MVGEWRHGVNDAVVIGSEIPINVTPSRPSAYFHLVLTYEERGPVARRVGRWLERRDAYYTLSLGDPVIVEVAVDTANGRPLTKVVGESKFTISVGSVRGSQGPCTWPKMLFVPHPPPGGAVVPTSLTLAWTGGGQWLSTLICKCVYNVRKIAVTGSSS